MSEFQLGLLAVGVLVIGAVLAYNRVQEKAARRLVEKAFPAGHADALLEGAPHAAAIPQEARSHGVAATGEPDAQVDYVVELRFRGRVDGDALADALKALERRFGRRLSVGDFADGASFLRAGLQMVGRDGAISETELIEFRAQLESLAAAHGATVAAPEMKHAVDAARELDGICAEADIEVAFHLVPAEVRPLEAPAAPPGPFSVRARNPGLTFSLEVPRTHEPRRAYEAMVRFARHLGAESGGSLVDDNGNALDERAIAAIGAQIDAVCRALEARGIAPGGGLALRLFS
jgi:hypothetical protein